MLNDRRFTEIVGTDVSSRASSWDRRCGWTGLHGGEGGSSSGSQS